jgi:hypothetical protein
MVTHYLKTTFGDKLNLRSRAFSISIEKERERERERVRKREREARVFTEISCEKISGEDYKIVGEFRLSFSWRQP